MIYVLVLKQLMVDFPDFFPNGVCILSPILTSAGATIRQISSHLPNSNSKHASCKQPQGKASMRFAAQKDPKRRQGYIQHLGKSNKPEGTCKTHWLLQDIASNKVSYFSLYLHRIYRPNTGARQSCCWILDEGLSTLP